MNQARTENQPAAFRPGGSAAPSTSAWAEGSYSEVPRAPWYARPVSTTPHPRARATVADLLAMPEDERFHELIAGERGGAIE